MELMELSLKMGQFDIKDQITQLLDMTMAMLRLNLKII